MTIKKNNLKIITKTIRRVTQVIRVHLRVKYLHIKHIISV